MKQKIIILGAGPGGYVAAIRASQQGADVTLVEKENVGGTCLNHGCIPSKVMKKTADLLDSFHHAKDFGITATNDARCDIESLLTRKDKVIQDQSKGILGLLKKYGIHYIIGTAFIPEQNRVRVSSPGNDDIELSWDKLIIATGSRPLSFPDFPFDGKTILSSNDALSYPELPERMTIVGGGVIGCEFAFIWQSLGCQVTLIEGLDRLLPIPSVDEECSKLILREMKKKKIKVHLKKTLQQAAVKDDKLEIVIGPSPFVTIEKEKDKLPITETTNQVVLCVGRRANSDNLGLENIGVETDQRGWIVVNDELMTSNENVYAIGDILGPEKVMLAHVASTEGEIAVENCFGAAKKMKYDVIPGAIFTMPEVGNVGLSEAQAREEYNNVRAETVQFRTSGKAQVLGELAGQIKMISDGDTNKILGVHIAGPHATDLLAEATLAMRMGATTKDITETIHAHPTLAEVILETSFKSLDIPLHG